MKWFMRVLVGIALAAAASVATAQGEQFIPLLSYRVGPYAAGGSGYFGGAIDYFTLVNMNGGINGVKLLWEECETEYNAARGVECYERLKTKTRRREHGRAAVDRHRLRPVRARRAGQDPDDDHSATVSRSPPTAASSPGCSRWAPRTGTRRRR